MQRAIGAKARAFRLDRDMAGDGAVEIFAGRGVQLLGHMRAQSLADIDVLA